MEAYELELRENGKFVGSRADRQAFVDLLEKWREEFRRRGEDPLGRKPTADLSRGKLEKLLMNGDVKAAGVILGAIEDFARALEEVIERFMKQPAWSGVKEIIVGGGFSRGRIGVMAIGRANALLKSMGADIELSPIKEDPDEAALIGAIHLFPFAETCSYGGMLAVDIGGSNIRAGVIIPSRKKAADKQRASVWRSELWRHRDEDIDRDTAVWDLVGMLKGLVKAAERHKIRLGPVIGIACPGRIEADGVISRGGQNLPGGNWDNGGFNLPDRIRGIIPEIGGEATRVLMHNDAVVQGLSEVPFMTASDRWAILTIGTGLGNAVFSNRSKPRCENI
ncbi:MAG TPA: hypothetical protein VE999_21775 [Gemmataceae bacterium]|nr:hypothetical protein [Gemmataceae bacterium]